MGGGGWFWFGHVLLEPRNLMPLTCSRFILSVSNFARQHLNSFKVLALHYCVSLFAKVFRAIARLYGFRIWDKCRLQIGRLVGKRGKHCCEMIYQLDSLSLNFKSSKSLVFGICYSISQQCLTSFTCQPASLQSAFVAHCYGFNP